MTELEKNEMGFYKGQDLLDIITGKTRMPFGLALELQTMRTVKNYPFKAISDFLMGRPDSTDDFGEKLCRKAIERLNAQGKTVDEADWFY